MGESATLASLLRCSRNGQRRHAHHQTLINLSLIPKRSLTIGHTEHGDVGDRIDKQTLYPNCRLGPERGEQRLVGALLRVRKRMARRKVGQTMCGRNDEAITVVLDHEATASSDPDNSLRQHFWAVSITHGIFLSRVASGKHAPAFRRPLVRFTYRGTYAPLAGNARASAPSCCFPRLGAAGRGCCLSRRGMDRRATRRCWISLSRRQASEPPPSRWGCRSVCCPSRASSRSRPWARK